MSLTSIKNKYERLVTAVQELSLARDIDTVTQIVKVAARELTGADGATFIFRDGDLCYYVDEYAISPLWKGKKFPMRTCISGWVMLNKISTTIEDIYNDERIPVEAYRPTFVKSLAMVPIRSINPMGAIGNYWAARYAPSQDEVDLLQSLADVTAVTLENINVYQQLEDKVKERTQQLEQANRELDSANKDLAAFAYSLSHDFRAPLRSINMTLGNLSSDYKGNLDEKGSRMVDRAVRKGEDMNHLLDGLTKVFTTGKKELSYVPVPMKQMVQEIFDELKESDLNRKIQFHLDAIPSVMADPFLIKQVWTNLLSNALKYSRLRSETTVTIGAEDVDDQVVYSIEDNGIGFDMKFYDKVFAPFQRLHRHDQFEGAGLGLSVAERIVLKHNGKMWAKSDVDKGATFFFSLPKLKDVPVAPGE